MAGNGVKVIIPVSELGPVDYDAATNSLSFKVEDIGFVAGSLTSLGKQLSRAVSLPGMGPDTFVEGAETVQPLVDSKRK